ncbi:hydroxyacid dehydrogenase [Calditrichota bacterium]
MRYRIFITGSGIAEEAIELLKKEKCIFEIGDPKDTTNVLKEKLKSFNPDGLIVRQGQITQEVQNASEKLRVICKHGVGTDNIDIEAATKYGIPVMFTPGTNYESVAEHTLALILSLIRKIPIENNRIKNGVFDKKEYDGLELLGKTMGIIGFGFVGKRICELISPLKMKVLIFDPFLSTPLLEPNIFKVEKPEDIYKEADIISIHCELTSETKNMINKDTIAMMKKNVFIINTARGRIINEKALLEALQNEEIQGAALDVFEHEPPDLTNHLFKMDNIVFTPHIAGMSDNSYKNMGIDSVKNVLAVLKGDYIDINSVKNTTVLKKSKN